MYWFIKVLKNYVNFSDRASRKEYWMFVLFNLIFAIAAMILDNVLGLAIKDVGYGPIYIIFTLALLLPSIALGVRRLHDIGKSGWYLLLGFIPCVGGIILLVFALTPGDSMPNQYGPEPSPDE